jgi:precorrin-6A/cobalt-precorrin-6A reductase
MTAAAQAGFPPERLRCLRPQVSPELKLVLWRQWQMQLVITKSSGKPGVKMLNALLQLN